MKKLLLVLLAVTLASFLLVGCLPGTTPDDDDGDGDGTGGTEVVVTISDSVVLDGKTWVSMGTHDITVTFPTPVSGVVNAYVGLCSGDYGKGLLEDILAAGGLAAVMFPNADRTVWTGSADFWPSGPFTSGCCASYVFISAGECEAEACIQFPVIVDACDPYALIEWEVEDCSCEGCAVTFTSTTEEPDCDDAFECCGDDCSGLASWAFTIYEDDPFDTCCDPSVCEEPIDSGSDVCPVDFTTLCLIGDEDGEDYWVVVDLVDNVGLETTYYALVVVYDGPEDDDCYIEVFEGFEGQVECVDWDTVSSETIGACDSPCGP